MAHFSLAAAPDDYSDAYAIQATAEQAGYEPWLHAVPDQLFAYPQWIEPQLRAGWALLVLLSPETQTDPALLYQWAFALGAGIPLIPLTNGEFDVLPPLAAHAPVPMQDHAAWLERLHAAAQIASAEAIPYPAENDALHALRAMLDSADADTRNEGIAQLTAHDNPAAHKLLLRAITHPIYADVRRAAVLACAQKPDPAAIPALIAALGDGIENVTQAAITTVAGYGADAIPALHEAITGPDRWRRNGAVLALARIDDGDTIPALLDALKIEHWYSSRAAAARLAQLRDARAIPALQAALERDDPHLQRLAQQALDALNA